MKSDRHIFTRREPRPIGILMAFIAALWLAAYTIGWIIINWNAS